MKVNDLTKSHKGRLRVLQLFKAVDEVRVRNASVPNEEIEVALNWAARR
jgi:hypothetical protein